MILRYGFEHDAVTLGPLAVRMAVALRDHAAEIEQLPSGPNALLISQAYLARVAEAQVERLDSTPAKEWGFWDNKWSRFKYLLPPDDMEQLLAGNPRLAGQALEMCYRRARQNASVGVGSRQDWWYALWHASGHWLGLSGRSVREWERGEQLVPDVVLAAAIHIAGIPVRLLIWELEDPLPKSEMTA